MAKRKRSPTLPVTTQSANEARNDRASRRAAAHDIRDQARRDRITTLNAVHSPLLRLPAELRDMIFAHVYTGMIYKFDDFESFETKPSDQYRRMASGRLLEQQTSDKLPLTCRQMHAETALLPYSLGTFLFEAQLLVFRGLKNLKRFLERRTNEQINAMANVELCQWSDTLISYWYQQNTAAYWVAKLEFFSASYAKMTSMERYLFDISSFGPSDDQATLS